MEKPPGLRERKKLDTKHRLGDVAARLFAVHGFDAVSVSDVARAANVADQTVFNYFPTKPELVLDRADEILERSRQVVAERDAADAPADAIRLLVHEDIDRFCRADDALARGEFPAQCLQSAALRRYALEFRNRQTESIAEALADTNPELPPLVARVHAAALVAVIDVVTVRIGAAILAETDRDEAAASVRRDADGALADAAQNFRASLSRAGA